MNPQLWIEPIGDLIIVRVRGVPSAELLRECHDRLLLLLKETGRGLVLYDGLEMEAPPVEVPLSQWNLDKEIQSMDLKRAIVVPNTRLAYLARLAFGEGHYRVFYNDLRAAINWLGEESAPRQSL